VTVLVTRISGKKTIINKLRN